MTSSEETTLTLVAPISGVIVPLADVPDPVFAQRLVGDGLAIDPLDALLVAPCAGKVVQVHRAGHAVTLEAAGLEIVIHVGLDTVRLNGAGFSPRAKAGDNVRTGDPLLSFDADYVATHARSLLTEMVVASMDRVVGMRAATGRVTAGRDAVLHVRLAEGARSAAPRTDARTVSAEVTVPAGSGIHARPAAAVAAAARRFASELRIANGGREANARSVVAIMALEIYGGDSVTVSGHGSDAAEAVAAVVAALASAGSTPVPPQQPATAVSSRTPRIGAADPNVLRGVPAAPGVAIGRVHHLIREEPVVQESAADPAHERRALDAALSTAQGQLDTLSERVAAESGAERAAIFTAHRELLEDPELVDAAVTGIQRGEAAAFAWRSACLAQAERLQRSGNPLVAGRAADLRDVGRRVLHLLAGSEGAPLEVPQDAIVVAEDIAPSETAALDRTRVRGLCTTLGSATSHVAILARGLGIPAVAAMDPRVLELGAGARVILDGDAGILHTRPDAGLEAEIARREDDAARRRTVELSAAAQPAVTSDGRTIEVLANIATEEDARRVAELGGDGVGLLRTEFLFMDRTAAPSEEEQARAYESIARALGPGRKLVIRALDIGGDKPLAYLDLPTEANPFLGERGIRLLLDRPEILRTQIRAMLRAAPAGRIEVMFPMIAMMEEWRAARELFERERAALNAGAVPLGIMVETAAAALLADRFAAEADFFSIGTNDLAQYTLAMDRTNPRLAARVDALHPSVLRLIERTVEGARQHGRPVAVCGALAGDPHAVPVLVGLGVDELSVALPVLPAVKAAVRALSMAECRELAALALGAVDSAEVRALVASRLREAVSGGARGGAA